MFFTWQLNVVSFCPHRILCFSWEFYFFFLRGIFLHQISRLLVNSSSTLSEKCVPSTIPINFTPDTRELCVLTSFFSFIDLYLRIIKLFLFIFKDFIYLLLNRGEGGEKERERNINVWLFLAHPPPGTWPTTQACAWLGIEPAALWFTGQCSIHWATPARTKLFLK